MNIESPGLMYGHTNPDKKIGRDELIQNMTSIDDFINNADNLGLTPAAIEELNQVKNTGESNPNSVLPEDVRKQVEHIEDGAL